jgi:hypothetical protein
MCVQDRGKREVEGGRKRGRKGGRWLLEHKIPIDTGLD